MSKYDNISGLKFIRKTYIGRFDCDECGTQYKDVEFTVDTWEIYCKVCENKASLPLRDVKLKIESDKK